MYSKIALIFGGGTGVRASTHGIPKQFIKVDGVPIIVRTILKFENSDFVDAIVLVCVDGYLKHLQQLVDEFHLQKVVSIVKGGVTGQGSIYNGLQEISKLDISDDAVVFIHDAVRPLITSELISGCFQSVLKHGSGIAAVDCYETVASCNDNTVERIFPRSELVHLRAPQAFYFKDIFRYHNLALQDSINNFTDSASMAKYYGHRLFLVPSDSKNIKITYPEDIFILKSLLEAEEHFEIIGI